MDYSSDNFCSDGTVTDRRYFDIESVLSNLEIKYSIYGKNDSSDTLVTNVAPIDQATNIDMTYCSSVVLQEMVSKIARSNARTPLPAGLSRILLEYKEFHRSRYRKLCRLI